MTEIRDSFRVGEKAHFYKTIGESDVSIFAGLTGDFNRIHMDAEFAAGVGSGKRRAHEMLICGLITTVLSCKLPGAGYTLLRKQLEFLNPVFVGDTVQAFAEVISWQPEKKIITLRTKCLNQNDIEIIAGEAVLMRMDFPKL